MLALTAAALYTPTEAISDPVVLIEDGQIVKLGPREEVDIPAAARRLDFADAVLAPGLIDVHIHGGAGHDVMEASDAALGAVGLQLARHGVTSYFPTTVTAPLDATLRSLTGLAAAIEKSAQQHGPRARPLGLHLEGPFISHARRGVHPPEHIAEPTTKLFERLWQAAEGRVSLLTIAPELAGAQQVITAAAGRGVCVSLGHSDAAAEATHAAVTAGARHATHTFNAMRPLEHREPGILGVVLSEPGLSADIIADGIHVAPETLRLFLAAKGDERAVLITDAISATGMPPGRYRLGGFEVEVSGGRCLSREGRLAGSVLTLDLAVRNVMTFADWPLQRALRLATANPARLTSAAAGRGVLALGHPADLVVLTPQGEVRQTFVGGVAVL